MAGAPRLIREHGGDRIVALDDDHLEVWTPSPIDGWIARRHRKVIVVIDDRRYALTRERRELEQVVYSLGPWAPGPHEVPGAELTYDASFVEARERDAVSRRSRQRVAWVLNLLSPLVGFLWSGAKSRIHERYHLHPLIATRRSFWVQLVFGSLGFVFLGPRSIVWWLCFPIDALLRFHSILADELRPWGLFEWTVGFFRKREEDAAYYPLEEERKRQAELAAGRRATEASAFVARLSEDRRLGAPYRTLHSDRMYRDGGALIVHASVAMQHWEPRKYRKLAIMVDGVKHHVVEALVHDALGDSRARYRLEPWPEGFTDLPQGTVEYDAVYVQQRDDSLREQATLDRRYRWLAPFSALIGFLWARTKDRLEDDCGVSPRSGTLLSVILELAAAICFATLTSLATADHAWPFPLPVMQAVTTLLAVDVVVRVLVILREREEYLGFWEWPFFLARRQ